VDIENKIGETVQLMITMARPQYEKYLKDDSPDLNNPVEDDYVLTSDEETEAKPKRKNSAQSKKTDAAKASESESSEEIEEVVLSRKEENSLDEQVLGYIKSNRQKGTFLSEEEIGKYRQTLMTEIILSKKIEIRNKNKKKKEKKSTRK